MTSSMIVSLCRAAALVVASLHIHQLVSQRRAPRPAYGLNLFASDPTYPQFRQYRRLLFRAKPPFSAQPTTMPILPSPGSRDTLA